MAININASTTSGWELTPDNSGNLNIQSGGSTKIAVTSAGANIVGTLTVNGVAPASGKVLQVVSSQITSVVSTTSSSYVDTGVTLSITPTSATSKILVIVSQAFGMYATSTLAYPYFILAKNGTTIADTVKAGVGRADNSSQFQFGGSLAFHYLDSPATTSAVTYKVQMKNHASYGGTIYANDEGNSDITLMEIAA